MFGEDARLILAMAAGEGPENQRVELIRFVEDDAGSRFEFHELSFAGGVPRLSKGNPGKCARCHYEGFRPIWESYAHWPGAYGQNDDAIVPGGAEHREFQTFLAGQRNHPLYRFLRTISRSPVAPYAAENFSVDYSSRPNLQFTQMLIRLNARRLQSLLEENRACYEETRAALAYALLGCSVPKSVATSITTIQGLSAARLGATSDEVWSHQSSDGSGPLKMALLQAMGVSREDYALGRAPRSWTSQHADGKFETADFLLVWLLRDLARDRPELSSHIVIDDYERNYAGFAESAAIVALGSPIARGAGAELCSVLESEALDGVQALAFESSPCYEDPHAAEVPVVAALCDSCHGPEGNAPRRNFATPGLLAEHPEWMASARERIEASGEARMPPDRALTARERFRLLRYFATLEPR